MQKVFIIALFCLALVSAQKGPKVKDWWSATKSQLLKSATFTEIVGKDKDVIVQFFAQFSTDCQRIMPEWDKLAEMYSGETPVRNDVVVAMVDGWTYNSISQGYGVTSFPDIMVFRKGDAQNQTRYHGEKTAEDISEWLEKLLNNEIVEEVPPVEGAETAPAEGAPADATNQNDAQADGGAQQATDNAAQPQATQDIQQQQPASTQPTDNTQAAQPQGVPPAQPAQAAQPTQPAAPAAPAQPAAQAAPVQLEPREVNVVLNTTLLQAQFEELQRHTTALNEALQKSINDNFHRFEGFQQLLDTHKQDLATVGNNVRSNIQKFDEVKQLLNTHKADLHQSVTSHTAKQVEELRNSLNQVKSKVMEQPKTEEPQGGAFGSGTVLFVVGGLLGAALTFVIVSAQGNRNRRKLLID